VNFSAAPIVKPRRVIALVLSGMLASQEGRDALRMINTLDAGTERISPP
jgi:hypothetical protein